MIEEELEDIETRFAKAQRAAPRRPPPPPASRGGGRSKLGGPAHLKALRAARKKAIRDGKEARARSKALLARIHVFVPKKVGTFPRGAAFTQRRR